MKTNINEHSLDTVIKYFVDGYKLKKREEIYDYEYFVDTSKNKVIIRLTIKNLDPDKEAVEHD